MSKANVFFLFFGVFICFFSALFFNKIYINETNRANNLYAHAVATACQDALELNADLLNETRDDTQRKNAIRPIWADIKARKGAEDTFYDSFSMSLNKDHDYFYHSIEEMTPFLCLIDYDGYYISYNAAFDENSTTSPDNENLNSISSLHTWAEKVGVYTIQYYLSDYVRIILSNGTIYEGDRRDVYAQIGDSALSYLIEDDLFYNRKNNFIVSHINDQIKWYVNNHNYKVDMYTTQYAIMLPTSDTSWCGLIDKPAICAFVQGNTYRIRANNVSIYGFGIYELGEPLHYFIQENDKGILTYYCYEEKRYNNEIYEIGSSKFYKGKEIDTFYRTKKDCALQGAYPEA